MLRSLLIILVMVGALASPAQGAPRAVSYADRAFDADFVAFVRPAVILTVERQCPRSGWFGDVQAYTRTGGALSVQRTERYGDGGVRRHLWRDSAGRAVTFDGVTWRNHTRRTVMVAGWCS